MTATSSIKNIKLLLEKFNAESTLLINDLSICILIYIYRQGGIKTDDLNIKFKKNKILIEDKDDLDFLKNNNFIEEKNELLYITKKGKDIINYIEFSQYDVSKVPKDIITGYILNEVIGKGSTSVTFKAVKMKTDDVVVIKIFKPGIFNQIDFGNKIKSISNLRNLPNLVLPDDFGEFSWEGIDLKFITMKYIKGKTLTGFLNNNVNVDIRRFLRNFFKEVGKTLEIIENANLNHADLHSDNILVVDDELEKDSGIFHFQIIDFMGIKSNEEFNEFELKDIDYFKQHLIKIVKLYASTPSGKPDLKKLGDRFYNIREFLLTSIFHTPIKKILLRHKSPLYPAILDLSNLTLLNSPHIQ